MSRLVSVVGTIFALSFIGLVFWANWEGPREQRAAVATAYARGVCDQARDSNLLQHGAYGRCVAEVSRTGLDQ